MTKIEVAVACFQLGRAAGHDAGVQTALGVADRVADVVRVSVRRLSRDPLTETANGSRIGNFSFGESPVKKKCSDNQYGQNVCDNNPSKNRS